MNLIINLRFFYFEVIKDGYLQRHHLYLGIIMMVVSFFCFENVLLYKLTFSCGTIITFDDLLQHTIQGIDKEFRSPIHVIGTKISVPILNFLYRITGIEWFKRG